VRYLLDEGAKVDAKKVDGVTPLHLAAQCGNIAIATMLLDKGAAINRVDGMGWTPLDRAREWQQTAMGAFLDAHGGKPGKT
jgi:ankyrin repeat protein